MFFNDFIEVAFIDVGVPRTFWINHHHRSFFTSIQTSCGIDTNTIALSWNTQLFYLILHVVASLLGVMVIAARRAISTLVRAEENMFIKIAHPQIPPNIPILYPANPPEME